MKLDELILRLLRAETEMIPVKADVVVMGEDGKYRPIEDVRFREYGNKLAVIVLGGRP